MNDAHVHYGRGIICAHVLRNERAVNYINHSPDDTWDFMCGEEDHYTIEDADPICVGCAFQHYIDGLEVDDVPLGFAAERPTRDARWVIRPMTEDELSDEDPGDQP